MRSAVELSGFKKEKKRKIMYQIRREKRVIAGIELGILHRGFRVNAVGCKNNRIDDDSQ